MAQRKSKKFMTSLSRGQEGEKFLIDLLNNAGINANLNEDYKNRLYDITTDIATFEVKYDLYAAKSGNIAIEIFQPYTNKPSGLTATQADFWVHVLSSEEVYVCRVVKLKEFVDKNMPDRLVEKAGDGVKATLLLYSKSRILPIFTNLVGMVPQEIKGLLCDKST